MESINEETKNIIKKANSDNLNEVEEGLNYIYKKMKSNDLKNICSNIKIKNRTFHNPKSSTAYSI